MARSREKLDGGVPVGDPQNTTTSGNVVTPVAGLSVDAGIGKPPRGGAYGAISDSPDIPSGSKMPGGNSKAMNAFFGSQNPGGGKK